MSWKITARSPLSERLLPQGSRGKYCELEDWSTGKEGDNAEHLEGGEAGMCFKSSRNLHMI